MRTRTKVSGDFNFILCAGVLDTRKGVNCQPSNYIMNIPTLLCEVCDPGGQGWIQLLLKLELVQVKGYSWKVLVCWCQQL